MKPLLTFLALIVASLVPLRPALAQESCDPNADPMDVLICKIDSLTATVDSLQSDLDEIAANVSPEWTWQGLWCVNVDALALDAHVGGDYYIGGMASGFVGVDAEGSGAQGGAEASMGGGIGIGLGAGMGVGGTWCFSTPPQTIEGPKPENSLGKGGFQMAGGYDMVQILEQSQAMKDGFSQVWGDFAEAVGNPTNLSTTAQSLMNGFSISDTPSGALSDFRSLASQVTDLLPLPAELKSTLSDPASLAGSSMDVDQLCSMFASFPDSDAWAKTLKYCSDGYPIEDPEAFVQDFNDLLNQEIDSDWLTSSFRTEWDSLVASMGGLEETLDEEFNPEFGGSVKNRLVGIKTDTQFSKTRIGTGIPTDHTLSSVIWDLSDQIGSFIPDGHSIGSVIWKLDGKLESFRSRFDQQITTDLNTLCGWINGCSRSPYRDDGHGGLELNHPGALHDQGPSPSLGSDEIGLQSERDLLEHIVPEDYFLEGAYPNPSQSRVTVQYGLPQAETVQIRVFDTAGREVMSALHRPMPAGRHSMNLDVSNLASGTYFYRIDAGAWVSSKTITVNN